MKLFPNANVRVVQDPDVVLRYIEPARHDPRRWASVESRFPTVFGSPIGRRWNVLLEHVICLSSDNANIPAESATPCAIPIGNIPKAAPRYQDEKTTNPKQQYGDTKPPLHLIHGIAELHESAALHSGSLKYGKNNYIETPVEIMTYIGAILRHIKQYVSGERVDEKELVHHLGAVRACAGILLTAEACGMLIDNRPRNGNIGAGEYRADGDWPLATYGAATRNAFEEVTRIIEHLNKLYPPKA